MPDTSSVSESNKGPCMTKAPMKQILFIFLFWQPVDLRSQNSDISVTGHIKNGGSGVNRRTYLRQKMHSSSQKDKEITYTLCSGKQQAKIMRLDGLTIRLTGSLRTKPGRKFSCFIPKEFTILKMPSGRTPLIGILKKINENYVINSEDGNTVVLKSTSGMDQYLDKKMILDVKPPPPVPAGTKAGVAAFMPYP